jgi:hypothetical protein
MQILQELGWALGFATLAGINLYLVVLIAGLAVRFDWIDLLSQYEQLSVLGDYWVIGTAGALFLVEFFADKVPWVDSAWDSVHTVVRPIGGVFLALGVLGELDPAMSVVAGLLAGGTTLATHMAKAGGRLFINLSPEPVSNTVASVSEDGLVLGGIALMAFAPAVAFFFFLGVVILAVILVTKFRSLLIAAFRRLRQGKNEEKRPA